MRIVLVDPDTILREGLRALLGRYRKRARIVGSGSAVGEVVPLVEALRPELLIADAYLTGRPTLPALQELRRRGLKQLVLILAVTAPADVVAQALFVGVRGFALKADGIAGLCDALDVVVQPGCLYLAPSIDRELVDGYVAAQIRSPLAALTRREREVFALLVSGETNATISEGLYISLKTAETHRARVLRKMHAANVSELVRFAARYGLL